MTVPRITRLGSGSKVRTRFQIDWHNRKCNLVHSMCSATFPSTWIGMENHISAMFQASEANIFGWLLPSLHTCAGTSLLSLMSLGIESFGSNRCHYSVRYTAPRGCLVYSRQSGPRGTDLHYRAPISRRDDPARVMPLQTTDCANQKILKITPATCRLTNLDYARAGAGEIRF